MASATTVIATPRTNTHKSTWSLSRFPGAIRRPLRRYGYVDAAHTKRPRVMRSPVLA